MNCKRPLILLSILILQFAQSFQPTSAVSNNNIHQNRRSMNSLWTKLSTLGMATTTSKVGNGTTKNTVDSATETSCDEKSTVVFSSSLLLDDEAATDIQRTALIVLNYPIPTKSLLLDHLWKTSGTRIAADGGANRLYEYSKELIPDRIRGDLDSLDPSVRAYYETRDVSVEQDFCQDTNDLDKALQVLNAEEIDRVVIYGAFGGRFDQEMASFAALYKWAPHFSGQLYLYSDETCAFLVPANVECEIRLPFYDNQQPLIIGEGPTCGLIPLGCRCDSIVTSGLKWDLDGSMPLEFGGLVSSSNRIMEPTVKIVASHPIVFTAELTTTKSS